MAQRLSGKQRAARIPLDYFKKRRPAHPLEARPVGGRPRGGPGLVGDRPVVRRPRRAGREQHGEDARLARAGGAGACDVGRPVRGVPRPVHADRAGVVDPQAGHHHGRGRRQVPELPQGGGPPRRHEGRERLVRAPATATTAAGTPRSSARPTRTAPHATPTSRATRTSRAARSMAMSIISPPSRPGTTSSGSSAAARRMRATPAR